MSLTKEACRFAGLMPALIATLSVSLLLTPLAARAQPAADTMARRMQACVACHGSEGRASPEGFYPRIAGKPAGYLFNQLLNFREGRRYNATMSYFVAQMSDNYLRDIANYFAALQLPYPPPPVVRATNSELVQGETLVLLGDSGRDVPACVQCHGATMTGVLPDVPGLLGLPRDYLLAQFGAWRTGQRKAHAPDCMATIMNRLSAQQLSTIATWLSAQTVVVAAPAASAPVKKPPLKCGTVTQ